jgi:hypothetical protein
MRTIATVLETVAMSPACMGFVQVQCRAADKVPRRGAKNKPPRAGEPAAVRHWPIAVFFPPD